MIHKKQKQPINMVICILKIYKRWGEGNSSFAWDSLGRFHREEITKQSGTGMCMMSRNWP